MTKGNAWVNKPLQNNSKQYNQWLNLGFDVEFSLKKHNLKKKKKKPNHKAQKKKFPLLFSKISLSHIPEIKKPKNIIVMASSLRLCLLQHDITPGCCFCTCISLPNLGYREHDSWNVNKQLCKQQILAMYQSKCALLQRLSILWRAGLWDKAPDPLAGPLSFLCP